MRLSSRIFWLLILILALYLILTPTGRDVIRGLVLGIRQQMQGGGGA